MVTDGARLQTIRTTSSLLAKRVSSRRLSFSIKKPDQTCESDPVLNACFVFVLFVLISVVPEL